VAFYEVKISATERVRYWYLVEADSVEEAEDKAEAGETEDEIELRFSREVTDRFVAEEPARLKSREEFRQDG
jgi:hypothetical protein